MSFNSPKNSTLRNDVMSRRYGINHQRQAFIIALTNERDRFYGPHQHFPPAQKDYLTT
jgi:hypothetical protein